MFEKFIIGSTYFSALPVVILGILTYKHLQGKYRGLFWFACFAFLVQLFSFVFSTEDNYTFYVLHIYVPIEFMFFSAFYANLLQGFIKKRVFIIIAVLLVTYSIVNTIFVQGFWSYNNVVRFICSFILSIYPIIYFMKVLNEMKIKKLSSEPMIWINTGILIYYMGNLFIFGFGHLMLNNIVWFFSSVLVDVFYGLMFIGLWKIYRKSVRSRQRPVQSQMVIKN